MLVADKLRVKELIYSILLTLICDRNSCFMVVSPLILVFTRLELQSVE